MKVNFVIFITGDTPCSLQALQNLKELCEIYFKGEYNMTVVDILAEPQQAEDHRIIATPTVIKLMPLPERRIVGDLSGFDQVLNGLGLSEITKKPRKANVNEEEQKK
ncbi:MAG: circadian clock KaiB family protein [Spirochaetes bacterium]|nr:circadian clock KaiB family protein [Spirochaetota bacterium]